MLIIRLVCRSWWLRRQNKACYRLKLRKYERITWSCTEKSNFCRDTVCFAVCYLVLQDCNWINSGNKAGETSVPLPEESNYSAQYEKRLDPFQRFGQAETLRSYARLPMHDRASLSIVGDLFQYFHPSFCICGHSFFFLHRIDVHCEKGVRTLCWDMLIFIGKSNYDVSISSYDILLLSGLLTSSCIPG